MNTFSAYALLQKASIYRDRRVASVFFLGLVQGFPWVMIGSMLTLWLKESGVSRANIGYATLIFSVYALNFLWSPVVEMVKPRLIPNLGQRQSWIFLCLLVIAGCCVVLSQLDSSAQAGTIVLLCLVIATFSATQDIAIDAYRVDSFAPHETPQISAAAGVITAGWWTGYAGMGAIPLILSDHQWRWPELYFLLGGICLALALITIFLPNPLIHHQQRRDDKFGQILAAVQHSPESIKISIAVLLGILLCSLLAVIGKVLGVANTITGQWWFVPLLSVAIVSSIIAISLKLSGITLTGSSLPQNATIKRFDAFISWLLTALVEPLREFFTRNGVRLALGLLAFIITFKLGEAFLGRMSIVFFKEVGFSNTQIATYSKLVTWWLTVVFALMSGVMNARLGVVKGLVISGLAMAGTNLLFSLIAITGPKESLYAIAVVLDGFASAWSTVAFVSFISLLCNQTFSATQYALMASLGNFGRTSLSGLSGQMVDWLQGNWALFFAITTVMIAPSLLILWRLRHAITAIAFKASQEQNHSAAN